MEVVGGGGDSRWKIVWDGRGKTPTIVVKGNFDIWNRLVEQHTANIQKLKFPFSLEVELNSTLHSDVAVVVDEIALF